MTAAAPRHVGWFYLSQLLATICCAIVLLFVMHTFPKTVVYRNDVALNLFTGFVYGEMTIVAIWFACGVHRLLLRLASVSAVFMLSIVTGFLARFNYFSPSDVVFWASLAAVPAFLTGVVVFAVLRFAFRYRLGTPGDAQPGYRFGLLDLLILIAASAVQFRVFIVYEPERLEEFGGYLRQALPLIPLIAAIACTTAWAALSARDSRLKVALPLIVFLLLMYPEVFLLDGILNPNPLIRIGGRITPLRSLGFQPEVDARAHVLMSNACMALTLVVHAATARMAGFSLRKQPKSPSSESAGPP